jgi:DNA-binding response OmpR family regulator
VNYILIVEDDLSIAELERDYLEMNGFRVDITLTGDEGLRKALAENYDLVILDIMLPGIDGFEICKRIRKTKDIPILLVTAKKEEIDKMRGFDFGADDYIVKPFSPSELVVRVKAHISRYNRLVNRQHVKDEIQVRGLQIDKNARRVMVNNEEKILTAKEFDLLTFLASHRNHVFNKEHLFERIWGFDAMGDISTVTVHIRKIREKIEIDPANPEYIETIWGAGYRFI